jgi:hypothetical protein
MEGSSRNGESRAAREKGGKKVGYKRKRKKIKGDA